MPKRDKLNAKEIEREYGFAYKFFKSDPELWKLLKRSIAKDYSPERFQAELKDTKWFRKHSDIWRQNTALRYSDPATFKERKANMRTKIANLAGQWGASLSNKELNRYTERAFMLGWDDGQLMDVIAKEVTPNKRGNFGGELAGIEAQLRETAAANGIRLGKGQLTSWMRSIVRGNADSRQFETYIRSIAAKTFGAFGEEIRSGMNAVEVAAPYIQSMSEILELNPADLNLYDPTIRRALSFRDPKTKEFEPVSLTDFEDQLRADKRWQYTDQAHEQMKGYGVALARSFGMMS